MGARKMTRDLYTEARYRELFDFARMFEYPVVDEIERRIGYSVSREWLDEAARVLNCPVKVNPPNWQHGRVIYAYLRMVLANRAPDDGANPEVFLDIGTAKGFSACVMAKAIADSGSEWADVPVHTVDVIDPNARVRRNTVVELSGLKTLYETMESFMPEGIKIIASGAGSAELLTGLRNMRVQIPFAFVDGKHARAVVKMEGEAIYDMQRPGDVVLFDDCQISEVMAGVRDLQRRHYEVEFIDIGPRTYGLGTRLS